MPATVLVRKAVVGKCCECLWAVIGRFGFAERELSAGELFGFSDIDPILAGSIDIKLNAVRIVQTSEVRDDASEFAGRLIPTVENVYDAAFVVGQVVHVGHKDAAVRSLCKKANTL